MTDFVLFYEHRARELESVCLLKEELRRRGYSVRVANTLYWRSLSTFLFSHPKVLVVPWLYGNRDVAFYNRFSIPVQKIVNLQCEQVYTSKIREAGELYPKDLAKKAFHVCWGKKEYEYLVGAGIPKEKLLLTGSISMDMTRPMFRSFYHSRHELALKYRLDEACSWKLFISSFSYVGLSNERLQEIDILTRSAFQFAEISKKTRQILLEWFEKYALSHPQSIFIYRPHPSEKEDTGLTHFTQRIPNIRVIRDESVRQWISCCDSINNWFSTSINDVVFLGKKCSTLRPIPIPKEMDNEELVKQKFITTYEEFEEFNKETEVGVSKEVREIVSQYYQLGKQPAYIELANCLENILHSRCEEDYSQKSDCFQFDPLWKRFRMACFVWISIHFPFMMKMIKSSQRINYVKEIKKECTGIEYDFKKISRKMRKIIKKEI